MKRQFLLSTAGLVLAAAFSFHALGGEQPGPGLEIIDGATDIQTSPTLEYPAQPAIGDPYLADPYQPAPAASADGQPWTGDPFAPADGVAPTPVSAPISGTAAPDDPYAAEAAFPGDGEGAAAAPRASAPTELEAVLADPPNATLDHLNVRNRNFPGLDGAAAQRNLRMAADIVWQVTKNRRVVDATMLRGPGGSVGAVSPAQLQQVLDAINHQTTVGDAPLLAAARINTILDAFASPVIDDYSVGAAMEQCLIRLRVDIAMCRDGMANPADDAVFLELSKTYIRAATTCDFFNFPRTELIYDIRAIMARSERMFYPDGSSVAGDIGGITGNLFQIELMLDFYCRDDSSFRRAIGQVWRTLDRPGRYLVDIAYPDQTLPRFGPRGTRELTAPQVCALDELSTKHSTRYNRIGLAASDSYPRVSGQPTYGGLHVTRSAQDPNARYLAMRVGPYGAMWGVPPHYDFGSLALMSRNIRFIVDAGGYGGDAAEPSVHSALSIDGQYATPATYGQPGEHAEAVWRTNASIDYLTAKAGFEDGKGWQRSLVYVKNLPGETRSDYWVILDSVDMNNDPQSRQARIRYQLAPGIQAYHDGSGIVATANFVESSALRIFAIDAGSELTVSEGNLGMFPSHIFDASGAALAAPSVTLSRTLTGDTTTSTLIYPAENATHRPARVERDSDIIRGRTGAIIIDHGNERVDVVAWAPLGSELVTPTLNLQMSADLAVFRLRHGKITRIDFVNLERFQAKEPDGGLWSMRVHGAAQTLTIEREAGGGWQVLADPANLGGATFEEVNFGPAITKRRFAIRPGEMRVIPR